MPGCGTECRPGAHAIIKDEFSSTLNSTVWTADNGSWSTSSGKLNVDSLTGSDGVLLVDAELDSASYAVKVKFPTRSDTNKAGVILARKGDILLFLRLLRDRRGRKNLELVVVFHRYAQKK